MDAADRAVVEYGLFLDLALADARRRAPRGIAADRCADCGSEIPEARRIAVPGAGRCADCQGWRERMDERHRRLTGKQ